MMITSKKVISAHLNNESFTLITHGKTRSGKSSHLIQVMAEVYGELGTITNQNGEKELVCIKPDWSAWEKWLTFLPSTFIKKFQDQVDKGEPGILLGRDDASIWASAYDWKEDFGKATSDLTAVQYTAFNSIIYTTPNPRWLLKHIRELPEVLLGKLTRPYAENDPTHRNQRSLRAYEAWSTPDFKKEGVKPTYEDHFKVTLPDDVYKKYNSVRQMYTKLAVHRYKEMIDKMRDAGKYSEADAFAENVKRLAGIEI